MRPFIVTALTAVAAIAATASQAEQSGDYSLEPIAGGGYAIERKDATGAATPAHGLAAVAALVPLLMADAAAPEKVDFTAGKKLDGVYTVLVGRQDGTLGKYEGASDIVIFAAPSSLTTAGDLTTLEGAIVFALKIDNQGASVAVQRLETGTITLTRARKSL